MKTTQLAALLLVVALAASANAQPLSFEITELATLGGTASRASSVNSLGQVVGEAANTSGELRAAIWDTSGSATDLGTLRGTASQAFAINDCGEITGRAARADGRRRAFYLSAPGAMMLELPTLGGQAATGTEDGTGFGINESSVIGGHARDAVGQRIAFSCSAGGGIINAGTPGGTNSRAWDINEAGKLAGWGRNAANQIVGYAGRPTAASPTPASWNANQLAGSDSPCEDDHRVRTLTQVHAMVVKFMPIQRAELDTRLSQALRPSTIFPHQLVGQ